MTHDLDTPEKVLEAVREACARQLASYAQVGGTMRETEAVQGVLASLRALASRIPPAPSHADHAELRAQVEQYLRPKGMHTPQRLHNANALLELCLSALSSPASAVEPLPCNKPCVAMSEANGTGLVHFDGCRNASLTPAASAVDVAALVRRIRNRAGGLDPEAGVVHLTVRMSAVREEIEAYFNRRAASAGKVT